MPMKQSALARIICGVADSATLVLHYTPTGGWVASIGGARVVRVEPSKWSFPRMRATAVTGYGDSPDKAIRALFRTMTALPSGARLVVQHGRYIERSVRWEPAAAEWKAADPNRAR